MGQLMKLNAFTISLITVEKNIDINKKITLMFIDINKKITLMFCHC